MTKQHLQASLRPHPLHQLESNLRREFYLSLAFFGLIGAFLLFGTIRAIDSTYADPPKATASSSSK